MFICWDEEGKYLEGFTNLEAAKESWGITFSKVGPISFKREDRKWECWLSGNQRLVGTITEVHLYSQGTHL